MNIMKQENIINDIIKNNMFEFNSYTDNTIDKLLIQFFKGLSFNDNDHNMSSLKYIIENYYTNFKELVNNRFFNKNFQHNITINDLKTIQFKTEYIKNVLKSINKNVTWDKLVPGAPTDLILLKEYFKVYGHYKYNYIKNNILLIYKSIINNTKKPINVIN